MTLSRNLPDLPTKGSPWRSSCSPGPSPTKTRSASGLPTPNTTWVRPLDRGQRAHTRACSCCSTRVGTPQEYPRVISLHVDAWHPGADAADDLVGDGVELVGPLLGGDLLGALPADQDD